MDSNTQANVFSMVVELPTSELAPKPEMHIWGRCSVRQDGKLIHADRAGHPSVSSFFNTDDTKLEYNASEPVNDRKRWLDQFVHLMGHTGNYSREEAIAEIDKERTLPDVLSFDPSKPAKYPNGRVFTDDVIDYRLAFLTKGECPPSGLKPHTDILKEFPYLGTPHQKRTSSARQRDGGKLSPADWSGTRLRALLCELIRYHGCLEDSGRPTRVGIDRHSRTARSTRLQLPYKSSDERT